MSRIEELIRELCPRGVEFQQLGEVARIKAGPNINKRLIADRPGPYPVINSGREPLGHVDHFNVEDDPIGIASRGSVGLVTWTKGRFFRGNLNYSCTVGDPSLLDSRFLYYYLLRSDPEIQALATHQGIPALNAGALKTLRVPIPPLELQREIVRVLDKFTQLEAELEAELEARRAQYEHYRNSLIAFSNDVERVALGDLGDLFGGLTGKSKVDFTGGNARFIAYTNVFHNIAVRTDLDDFVKVAPGERQRTLAYGDVLFTGSSESADEVGMTSVVTSKLNEPVYLNSFSIGFRPYDVERLDPEFAKHLFRSHSLRSQIVKTANGVTRFNVSKTRLRKIQVPLPSRAEQARIARVLDNFEELTNDLTIGLPAELAARRKQYEHYRDRLLTFKELAS